MQVKLLRVLQEKQICRIGSTELINIDVRIIAATKVDLKKRVEENLFRKDLYYRLNIIPLILPPLRERKEDIPELIKHFFTKHNAQNKINLLTPEIYKELLQYNWEGNVRELENIVQRIIALA
jgi:transcriptional regulator with PAS, ATPase and Fis domain